MLYVCENNLYGEWSALSHTTAGGKISARAAAYGFPGVEVDGNDVLAVREVASEAVARARRGEGPTLIEARTYRHKGHSRVDPGKYRPKDEVEEWLARDPIPRLAALMNETAVARIQERLERELEASLEEARSAPFPSPDPAASAHKGA